MIIERKGTKYSMDKRLYEEMQKFTLENLKKKDKNKLFLVCGSPGAGKSAFGFQMASMLDKDFSLDEVGFTSKEFKDILFKKRNRAVVFDEAFRGMSGRNTLGKEQKELMQSLMEIRQLNQVVFLISPSFFRLDEAIAVELSDALFYIYERKDGQRIFKVFNRNKKEQLYYKAKKYKKSYNIIHTNMNGMFHSKTYVINEEKYREQKYKSLFGIKDKAKEIIKKGHGYDKEDRELRLLAAIVNREGSYGEAGKLLAKFGVELDKSGIHSKIARKPEIQALVTNK